MHYLSILRFESFLFRFSMSGNLNLPKGVPIPGWFRRYLEARANDAGPADIPPPAAAIPPPPPPPRAIAFLKICKDFRAMGGKDFKGTESFVEARNWLKELRIC